LSFKIYAFLIEKGKKIWKDDISSDEEEFENKDEDENKDEEDEEDEDEEIDKIESINDFSIKTSNNNRRNKYSGRIDTSNEMISSKIKNEINNIEKNEIDKTIRIKGKESRATTEQVLDPRTRMILFKLVNSNFLYSINGCISTGKEANVYFAQGINSEELAIKVYKTSILVFKDRDKYVTGEYRFRKGYSKHNPRKNGKYVGRKRN